MNEEKDSTTVRSGVVGIVAIGAVATLVGAIVIGAALAGWKGVAVAIGAYALSGGLALIVSFRDA